MTRTAKAFATLMVVPFSVERNTTRSIRKAWKIPSPNWLINREARLPRRGSRSSVSAATALEPLTPSNPRLPR